MRTPGSALKTIREKRKLKGIEFAEVMGIGSGALSTIESGKNDNFGIQAIVKLSQSDKINLTPEELWSIFSDRKFPKSNDSEINVLNSELQNKIEELKKQVEKLEHEKDRLYTIIERLSQQSVTHQEGAHTNDRDNQG